ncbi:MATE family efflux transporter [Halapricum hydrolyticum]|uniref:MATE family efflux transporter n=1 Tax=Halapricum hydrolyticum TaxID=2979991 RepID=A0AAE3IAN5_9EURY|nr:MATE family efflux transporter [Halapricum hydrolyticum]MCU4717433.1 MATE family efflux transporter [Halapricum hydrolyticum]MCU4726597.1 MATE family efflux transporter [Halapricum hydrolyticum]
MSVARSVTRRLSGVRERIGQVFRDPDDLDLTSGGIAWPLFYLSLPIIVTNLLQTAYNLTDTFWVGRYSTAALTAITFSFPLVFLMFAMAMGLAIAGSVLVAQNVGADDEAGAEFAASQTVVFSLTVSLGLGLAGYAVVEPILGLLGAGPAVRPLAADYMRVIALGMPFMFGFAVFISLMRGYGDTVTPMLVMFGSVVINIAIDPFVIFGWGPVPELGITGAAVATVASRGLAMVVGLAIMFRGTYGVEIHRSEMRPDLRYWRKLLRIGVPGSIEVTGRALSVTVMLFIVGQFANGVVAGFGVVARVNSIVFLPAIAVSQGVETMTGQNVGADRTDRAEATNNFAARVLFVVLTAMGVVAFVFAEPIIGVFTGDPAVIEPGSTFLRYAAPSFGFIGIMRAYVGGFRGTGGTLTAAAVTVVMLWLIRLPIAWFGAGTIGQEGVWTAFAVSNVAGAVIALLWFRRGAWKHGDVVEDTLGIDLGTDPKPADD